MGKHKVRCRTAVKYIELMGPADERVKVHDPQLWPGLLESTLYSKFGRGSNSEEQDAWIALAIHQLRARRVAGEAGTVSIPADLVSTILQQCSEAKAPGPDGLSYALYKSLPPEAITELARHFEDYANSSAPQTCNTWQCIVLTFIPKGTSRQLTDMRALASIDALQRIYVRCLLQAIYKAVPLRYPSWQYGFVPGKQCADMLHVLQSFLLKGAEWGVPVVLCKLDISNAFDGISYHRIWGALLDMGVPIEYGFPLLRELLGCQAYGRVGQETTESAITLERGGRQGGPETPFLWNCYLRYILQPLLDKWSRKEVGVSLEQWMRRHGRSTPAPPCPSVPPVSLVVWADDVVLLAHDISTLQDMVTEFSGVLNNEGLRLKAHKAEVLVGKWAAGGAVLVGEAQVAGSSTMSCLGAMLRADGATHAHLEGQLAKASAAFAARAAVFKAKHGNLRDKVRLWMSMIAPMILWAFEIFPIVASACQRLDSLQLRHMVYMMHRRGRETTAESWQSRFRLARRLMHEWGVPQLSQTLRQNFFKYAGHAARQGGLGWQIHKWRGDEWWYAHMSNMPDHQVERRPTPGHRITWDGALTLGLGAQWHTHATDRDAWRHLLPQWLARTTRERRSGFRVGLAMQ